MPSANVAAEFVAIGRPASSESRYMLARSETTPTTLVFNPIASRAPITPQIPEPRPIGTYTTSRSPNAVNSSCA